MTFSYRLIEFIFFIAGILILGYGVIQQEISVGIVVFFPFVIGSGPYIAISIMMFFCAMIVLLHSFSEEIRTIQKPRSERDTLSDETKDSYDTPPMKTGGIILIGPIPIVFGSTKKMVVSLLFLTLLLLVIITFVIPLIVH